MASPAFEGGSGWIFKRRLFKGAARTPYERPPSAARVLCSAETVKGKGGGWLPKFVEPASRFIARASSRLFSSVLRKRLSAPLDASGAKEKHLVRSDTHVMISTEQRVANDYNLITSVSTEIFDIEQQLRQSWFTRNEAKYVLELIKSRSSKLHKSGSISSELHKSESKNNKQEKALKRDNSFLDDDDALLGPKCKIPKKSIAENFPFTRIISGSAFSTNGMDDVSTSIIRIRSTSTTTSSHISVPSQSKFNFHMSALEDLDLDEEGLDEEVAENDPLTIVIIGDAIAMNEMNDASSSNKSLMIRSANAAISSHATLPSQRNTCFRMSALEDFDLDDTSDSDDGSTDTHEEDTSDSDDGSTDTYVESDFAFPVLIDIDNGSPPPSPIMLNPSHAKLPFSR